MFQVAFIIVAAIATTGAWMKLKDTSEQADPSN
jgi:hypothetical protein